MNQPQRPNLAHPIIAAAVAELRRVIREESKANPLNTTLGVSVLERALELGAESPDAMGGSYPLPAIDHAGNQIPGRVKWRCIFEGTLPGDYEKLSERLGASIKAFRAAEGIPGPE